jgi:predicted membrane protein
MHIDVDGGTIVDERGAIIGVATLFSGPIVGFATAFVEAVCRLAIGGKMVWVGVGGIALDLLAAYLVRRAFSRKIAYGNVPLKALVFCAIAVAVGESLSFLFFQPMNEGVVNTLKFGPSLFLSQFIGTLLFGGLLKMQDERTQALQTVEKKSLALRELLRKTVAALSSAMVHRDPTTAGHERHVAELSLAIGRELGMDQDQLEGLQLAALVHDVGQIQIPTEILTRARRLSPEEFELVKMHAEAGYTILRDIPFPWPVAEVVLQHHENVDGSGYPNGLKGDELLLEAKIIRVADSVESMLSHRPFRRSIGPELALEELKNYSGKHFDPSVVDACIKIITKNDFKFPTN